MDMEYNILIKNIYIKENGKMEKLRNFIILFTFPLKFITKNE